MNVHTIKIFLIILFLILLDFLIARIYKNPKIFSIENSKMSYNAQTVPPIGIFIQKEDLENTMLHNHELIHWKQYRRTGAIIFYIKYFFYYLTQGYDHHHMEIEARE